MKMKVSELKKILSKQDNDNEVIFYNLENHNLKEFKLESIIEADNRCEITTYDNTKLY
tara:strand:+ start:610 stop:783 length:174 start_codon:yes stop_codon:yes gene_type:complete